MRPYAPSRQSGFSLIELSVATAIYSLGLGSLSLLFLLAVHGTAEARYETVATLHADSLAELILMNPGAVGHYITPPGAAAANCAAGRACDAAEMAAWELADWHDRLAADLPAGDGLVCRDATPNDGNEENAACDGGGAPVIKVFWRTTANNAAATDKPPARRVRRLPLP